MAIRTRIDPIDRDIELLLRDMSPQAAQATVVRFAREQIEEARKINQRVLGRSPNYTVTVDGSRGAPLTSVKPNGGIIIVEFEIVLEALAWINTQLQRHSPVLSGLYAKSHELFADDVHVENPNNAPPAEEYVFLNVQPYARKIERGSSSQAPDGVYQAVATLGRKFGNSAKVSFAYRSAVGFSSMSNWSQTPSAVRLAGRYHRRSGVQDWLTRQPAIIVRPNVGK